jgi:hypothetical protein
LRRRDGVRLALSSLLLACTSLPAIGADECGNGVIEPPEDCDGFGVDGGASCRAEGSVGECRLDCSASAGSPNACPAGWGCDLGGICRRPTGAFEPPREHEVGTAAALASADFDGDGRTDVMSTEPLDPFGGTRIKFHYFDEQGVLEDTRSFPHALISPVVSEMTGDTRRDVVFTDGRVGVLLGRTDRSWVPETFSSYRIENTAIRTLTLRDEVIEDISGFVVFSALSGAPGVYVPGSISNGGFPILLGELPYATADFVGEPVAAQIIEGDSAPCRQAIVAERGATSFTMIDACERTADGTILWRRELIRVSVALEPPEPIVSEPRVADMNGDGHLDVIVGGETRAFVAFGDGQSLATAVPFPIALLDGELRTADMPMPLAAGDVTGDGIVDLVFPVGILLSSEAEAPVPSYRVANIGQPPYSAALIADVNANGYLDIIAGGRGSSGLHFLNGRGTSALTYFSIPTSRPVERLITGDFDGDLIEDVAFSQVGISEDVQSSVMMSFGVPFGAPLPPTEVARLGTPVEQLGTFREDGLSHLLIASSESNGGEQRGVLTLLTGSGDRIPVALYELTTFAADGSVNGSEALRVLGGTFLGNGPGDVLGIGFDLPPTNTGAQFWLLPAVARSEGTPVLLGGTLAPEAAPVAPDQASLRLATAVADVDGDGRDEVILATPAQDEEHCALQVYGIEPDHLALRGSVLADEPCARADLAVVDADADGHVDIVWNTGRADGSDRQLSVLWNDGAGVYSIERRTIVVDRLLSPQAFALLPATTVRALSIAYATGSGLELVPLEPTTRVPGEVVFLLELPGCTGLSAPDLNGDGARDLVAAARGNLTVLEAALEAL